MPGTPVEAGGVDLYEHLVGSDHRPVDLGQRSTSAVPYSFWTIARIRSPASDPVAVGCSVVRVSLALPYRPFLC